MKMRYPFAIVMFLSTLETITMAAERDSASKAIASQLFDDAQSLLEQGKVSEACDKYAESQRLDPQLGTMLYLADCYAQLGKNASAWASFKDAVEIAAQRRDQREAAIRDRLAELELHVCRLTIRVATGAPAPMSITNNNRLVSSTLLGSAMPVDPGEYVVVAKADGCEDWVRKITITPDSLNTVVDIPPLISKPMFPAGHAQSSVTPDVTLMGDSPSSGSTRTTEVDSTAVWRRWGYILGAAGAAGMATGIGFGIAKNAKQSERDSANACSKTSSCTTSDKKRIDQLTNEARTRATVANIGLIAGGATVAAGAVLVLTAWPRRTHNTVAQVTPWVGDQAVGLAAGGSW